MSSSSTLGGSSSSSSTSKEVSHYVVTAHPPGAVFHSVKCRFLSPDSANVVLAKSHRLEVRDVLAHEPLFPISLQAPINGRITSLVSFNLSSASPTDFVFFTTDAMQYAVISYDPSISGPHPLRTHASGSLLLPGESLYGGKMAESGPIVVLDPQHRCIAIHIMDGFIHVLPIRANYKGYQPIKSIHRDDDDDDDDVDSDRHHPYASASGNTKASISRSNKGSSAASLESMSVLGEPFHCRIEESRILAMNFVPQGVLATPSSSLLSSTMPPPLLAVLHQDSRGAQHLISHVINLSQQQLHLYGSSNPSTATTHTQWIKKSHVDGGSSLLVPVPPIATTPSAATAAASSTAASATGAATTHGDDDSDDDDDVAAGYRHGGTLLHQTTTTTTTSTGGASSSGAILILGQKQFTYVSPTTTKVIPVAQALYLTYTALPPEPDTCNPRYLIGDEFGNLHMLTLIMVPACPSASSTLFMTATTDASAAVPTTFTTTPLIVRLQLDTLGSCTIGNTLCYLDHGVVFVGSVLGDSQLIQIADEPMEHDAETLETTYLSVLEEYTHLGPILDFDLIPTQAGDTGSTNPTTSSSTAAASSAITSAGHNHGLAQSQVVTASGSSQSGTLRLIRNGIGMNESAAVEIPGIQAVWAIQQHHDDPTTTTVVDVYLIQSFVSETRVLGVVGDGLEEVTLPGLDATCSTLYVGNVGSDSGSLLVQVTPTEVRLIDVESGIVLDSFCADITVAAANRYQVSVALRGGKVVLFRIDNSKLIVKGERNMDRDVSCLDLHPFTPKQQNLAEDAMLVDNDIVTGIVAAERESDYLAVGLWDDCTVRLLDAAALHLDEVLCIKLEEEDEDALSTATGGGTAASSAAGAQRHNRNNMMARSLCLLTLDFSSSANVGNTNNSNSNAVNNNPAPGVDMLFVGLGDGTLISFAVVSQDGKLAVRSKKEVCLGTQRINLVPLYTEQGGACVLATGDRPTVIYLAGVSGNSSNLTNPKLCYSNVNLSALMDEDGDGSDRQKGQQNIAVNVATPFFNPVLFDPLGHQHYSLCVADDTHLRLGVIDDIQKLHVTTCRLGMAPRRISHCASGRLFAVACIESGINHVGLSENEGNMTNCIRFMDDTTFDDIERIDMEPFEMILSLAYVTLKVPSRAVKSSDGLVKAAEVATTYKPFLLVGTAFALPDEDEPTRGRILVFSFQNEDSVSTSSRAIRQVTEMSTNGGVYSICQFYNGKVLCTVNTKTMLCHLVDETGFNRLEYLGTGHHGHILSLCVRSRALRSELDKVSSSSGTIIGQQQPEQDNDDKPEMLAIVGDLMRSVSLVQYYPGHETLEEIARDFTANWTTACEMLNDNVYLAAENFHNLFCLRRNHASSEEVRCRLDTIGEFHLGEQCNKFMCGSLVMPMSSHASSTDGKQARRRLQSSKKSANPRARRAVVVTGSQVLFGTVEGTLGVVLGLDGRTAAFFTSLERALAEVIKPVGDLPHHAFRTVQGPNRSYPAHGFVDGDLVESFLDLDRNLMEAVVNAMNHDGSWEVDDSILRDKKDKATGSTDEQDDEQDRTILSVEDVLAMVEEMAMLH